MSRPKVSCSHKERKVPHAATACGHPEQPAQCLCAGGKCRLLARLDRRFGDRASGFLLNHPPERACRLYSQNENPLGLAETKRLDFLFVLAVGLVAGTISGIVGTGSSIMLMPVLVYQYGPKQAVPIMAVAAVMANLSRILAWWHEVDWRACDAYSITGIPAAA